MTDKNPKDRWENFTDEIEVAGHQLVEQITKLIAEGNVRKIRIHSSNDDVVLEVPLNAGAVVGGVVVLAAPWLAVLGALAGVLAKVRIEIIRDADGDGIDDDIDKDDDSSEDEGAQ